MPKDNASQVPSNPNAKRRAAGQHVKLRISAKGMSIKEYASLVGSENEGQLSRIINGRKRIDLTFAEKFANSLGNNVDYWLTLEEKISSIDPELFKANSKESDEAAQIDEKDMERDASEVDPSDAQVMKDAPRIKIDFRNSTMEFEEGVDPEYLKSVADTFGFSPK